MKSTSYEFKHTSGGKSAYISHDQYDTDDSEEFMSHVPGEKSLIHSTWNKAQKRLAMHGYEKHEDPIEESAPVGKSFKSIMSSITEAQLNRVGYHSAIRLGSHEPNTFGHSLAVNHNMDADDVHSTQSRALFDLTYSAKSPFKDVSTAKAFLNSPHGAKLSDSHKNVIAHPEFRELVKKFGYEAPTHIVESADVNEAAAPGMEDWIRDNKEQFVSQYGEKKGTSILYATSWKLHDNKVNEEATSVCEMVMDAIQHPTLGRVEWRNEGGKHMITMDNKKSRDENVVNIHTMGPHKEFAIGSREEITKKWGFIKSRLLKEDADWQEIGGLNNLIESVVTQYEEESK